ncbi:Hypothetical predicted protein [Olea europaea subsp. europaea]|uniref:Pentatricopeptide repeat-containing protein n=1 Tax=Olea europaea subsp. europaea TaxID=158383 RepID=A0A8S0R2F8_OLEEU|nr:Hypothetical predicted protein [Olea europaea subsp. europaea]
MDCVGLKLSFSMIEKVISFYWEVGDKEGAVLFVKEVLRRGITCLHGDTEDNKGGPVGYLAWKIMVEGSYMDATKLVIHLRECGLKPELYRYLIAMIAIVKELNDLGKAPRKLKGFHQIRVIVELDAKNVGQINQCREDVLDDVVRLSKWVVEVGGSSIYGVVHERLLAMYMCCVRR